MGAPHQRGKATRLCQRSARAYVTAEAAAARRGAGKGLTCSRTATAPYSSAKQPMRAAAAASLSLNRSARWRKMEPPMQAVSMSRPVRPT